MPALWACTIDLILTIINQPIEYWHGSLQVANEGNPIIIYLMKISVYGLFIFLGLWLLFIGIITLYLSPLLTKMLSLFVLIAHTYGAASWLSQCCGFWAVINYIILNSVIFVVFESIYSLRISNA